MAISKINHNLESYRLTVEDKNDPSLLALKQQVRAHNARVREMTREKGRFITKYTEWSGWKYDSPVGGNILRLKLQGRGPRAIHARADFGPRGARRYDAGLPHKYATHFDVYVYVDNEAEAKLHREIKGTK